MKFDAFSGVVIDVRPQELMKSSVFHSWTRNSQCFWLSGSKGVICSREVEMAKPGGNGDMDSEAIVISCEIKLGYFFPSASGSYRIYPFDPWMGHRLSANESTDEANGWG